MTDGASVRFTGLSVAFSGRTVVRGVTLDVPARGVFVLMGRSGSGKTTLLRAVNRLNEEFPDCRTTGALAIRLGGVLRPVHPCNGPGAVGLQELRRSVGMVFQTPQVFPLSIRRNMEMPLYVVAGLARRECGEKMRSALEQADLWDEVKDRLDMPAERLSGGQQQRLCLARALSLDPAVLLVDEPTASLDVRSAAHVEDLLSGIAEARPVIMVSHNPAQGLRMASHLAVMREGRLTAVPEDPGSLAPGDVEQLLDGPESGSGGEE